MDINSNYLVNVFGTHDFINELAKNGFSINLCVSNKITTLPENINTKLLWNDAKSGDYSSIIISGNNRKYPFPLSEEDLQNFAEVERIFLKLADRLGFIESYQWRKDLYLKLLSTWIYIIKNSKVKFAIFENLPHEGFDFIAYSVYKYFNIKCFCFYQMPIRPKKTYLLQLITNIYNHGELINFNKENNIKSNDYKSKFAGYLEISKNKSSNLISFTRKKNVDILNIKFIYSKYLHPLKKIYVESGIRKILQLFIMKMGLGDPYITSIKKLNNISNQISIKPDLTKLFIYLPLHYQPELSTSPLAKGFVDQIVFINLIAHCAQKFNIHVYVKEHPRGGKALGSRTIEFYKNINQIDNVSLIDKNSNSYELIDKCVCLASISGTAGWEAVLRNKPVLMVGPRFYSEAPGVFKIHNADSCEYALNSIVNNEVNINSTETQLNEFLSFLSPCSIEGFIDRKDKKIATVSRLNSIKNQVNLISNYINLLKNV